MRPDHNSGTVGHRYTSLSVGGMHLSSSVSRILLSYGQTKYVPQAFLTVGGGGATDMSVLSEDYGAKPHECGNRKWKEFILRLLRGTE